MNSKKYPGWQRMISFDPPQAIQERHQRILKGRGIPDAECSLRALEPTLGLEKHQGYQCNYELHWTTYKGWQAYMEHAGIFAYDSPEEAS